MSLITPLTATQRLTQQQESAASAAAQSQQNYNSEQSKYFQNQEDYISGKRNPVADLIKKPERDAAKEERLKQVAKWSFISDAVSLIGKGYAASKGVMPTPMKSEGTYKALNELGKLDDIYREEGYRYDQNMMLDALRRQGASTDLAKTKLGIAQSDSNYNRGKADQLGNTALSLAVDGERRAEDRAYNKELKLEDRAFQKELAELAYKRQVELLSIKAGNGANSSDYAGYQIRATDGSMIPMSKTLEGLIVSDANKRGIAIAANNVGDNILLSNPSNSPARRAEIQRLYDEVEKANNATTPEDVAANNLANTSPKFQKLVANSKGDAKSNNGNENFMQRMSAEIFPKLYEAKSSDRPDVLEEYLNRMPESERERWIIANQTDIERLIGK